MHPMCTPRATWHVRQTPGERCLTQESAGGQAAAIGDAPRPAYRNPGKAIHTHSVSIMKNHMLVTVGFWLPLLFLIAGPLPSMSLEIEPGEDGSRYFVAGIICCRTPPPLGTLAEPNQPVDMTYSRHCSRWLRTLLYTVADDYRMINYRNTTGTTVPVNS